MPPLRLAGYDSGKTQNQCAFGPVETRILTPHQHSRSFALGAQGSASCVSQRFSISVKLGAK